MALTPIQKDLVAILKEAGLEADDIIGAKLLVKDSEEAIAELGIWVYDNKVTSSSDILGMAVKLRREFIEKN